MHARESGLGERIRDAITNYCETPDKSNFEILCRPDVFGDLKRAIPLIVDYALRLPNLLAKPVPILAKGKSKTLLVTKELACSLVANAFLCTFPEENERMTDFNFFSLFRSSSPSSKVDDTKAERLKCILNYFYQMRTLMTESHGKKESESHIISFERTNTRGDRPKSENLIEEMEILISDDGNSDSDDDDVIPIEPTRETEETKDKLNIDFDGGVLNSRAAMEVEQFFISPELLVSRLFTEPLDDDEMLVITGVQQFSKYSGYGCTFKYVGPFVESTSEANDNSGRDFMTQVVTLLPMTHYISGQMMTTNSNNMQFGYSSPFAATPIATGNWGNGLF